MKRNIEKLTLLSLILYLFLILAQTAKTEEAANKEPRFYTIFSGDIGGGLLAEYHSYKYLKKENWDWNTNDPVYSFAGSIRICRLSSSSTVVTDMRKKNKIKLMPLSEQAIGGFGVEMSIRQLRRRAKIDVPLDPSYWRFAKNDLFYEFQSTSFTPILGSQVIDRGLRYGLFIGYIGIGYTQNQFINYFWDTVVEMAKKEEGEDIDFNIKTKVAPIVFTILPIKLDWLFYQNMAMGLNFSGVLFYPAKTVWIQVERPGLEFNLPSGHNFWFATFQIGLTLSIYLH